MRSILLKLEDIYMNNRIFGPNNPYFCLREALKEHGISYNTADLGNEEECEKIIVYNLNSPNILYVKDCAAKGWQNKLILVLGEPPVVIKENGDIENHKYFTKIFTWDDDLVDNQKYFKYFVTQVELPYYGIELPFSEKKLCTMIVSNKMYHHPKELYSERVKAIRYFEEKVPEQFDLYGYNWDYSVKSYRGTVIGKERTFAGYKYAICYENMTGIKGLISEKIFDCFRGGCVPIYLGADNITDYIPPDTFIDKRDFGNYEDLLDYLLSIDEHRYNQYLESIAAYAHSDKFKLFGIENYVNIMLPHLI